MQLQQFIISMGILCCSSVVSVVVLMVTQAHVGQVFWWNLNVVLLVKDFELVQFAQEGGVRFLAAGDGGSDGSRESWWLKERFLIRVLLKVVVSVRLVAICIVIPNLVFFIESHKCIPILYQL